MKLPIRLTSNSRGELTDALNAVAQRLDRLITLSEQTNDLLRAAPPATRAETPPIEGANPAPPRRARRGSVVRQGEGAGRSPTRRPRAKHGIRGSGLHDAIEAVLHEAPGPLTAAEIAQRINDQHLFVPPRSHQPLGSSQVNSRISNAHYRKRFRRENGRVALAADSGPAQPSVTEPS